MWRLKGAALQDQFCTADSPLARAPRFSAWISARTIPSLGTIPPSPTQVVLPDHRDHMVTRACATRVCNGPGAKSSVKGVYMPTAKVDEAPSQVCVRSQENFSQGFFNTFWHFGLRSVRFCSAKTPAGMRSPRHGLCFK